MNGGAKCRKWGGLGRLGGINFEFRGDLWLQETRVPGLSCGIVCVILRLAVLVELRLVTDKRTDGHMHG